MFENTKGLAAPVTEDWLQNTCYNNRVSLAFGVWGSFANLTSAVTSSRDTPLTTFIITHLMDGVSYVGRAHVRDIRGPQLRDFFVVG